MLSLRELQVSFTTAVLDGPGTSIGLWVLADGLDPNARIDIYRNNAHAAFLKALALEFPVIQRLVGEDYFRQLALEFQAGHPSRNGDLQQVGAPFAAFLRTRFTNTPYAYLPDTAALEWACQESLTAPDAAPLDLTALQILAPHRLVGVRFDLDPACRLIQSEFPIVRIWLANQEDRDGTESIDLRTGPDLVLLTRARGTVEFHHLPAADFNFLQSLQGGRTLGEALETAQEINPAFDLGAALRQLIALHVFTTVQPT